MKEHCVYHNIRCDLCCILEVDHVSLKKDMVNSMLYYFTYSHSKVSSTRLKWP